MSFFQEIQNIESPVPSWLRLTIFIVALVTALLLEQLFPLRKAKQPKLRRVFTNLGLATISTVILRFSFYPFVMLVSYKTDLHQAGLLPLLGVSGALGLIASLLLLDGTLFYWHWMMHRIPFLWRFHNVHHMDLDLDTSTALRFHFGELMLSTAFRSAQIVIFGITPFGLALFELLVTTCAQIHHGNFKLPLQLERILTRFIITPRLHGIHHSTVQWEADSNFGAIFSWWDSLHGTRVADVMQKEITIGVPSYSDTREQNLWRVLVEPFRTPRAWRFPDGHRPSRRKSSGRELAP